MNLLRNEGWSVVGLNLPLELSLQPTFNLRKWLIQQPRAKLVLIDLHWYEHSFGALDVAGAVKSTWPSTPIVIGGLTTTHFAQEILGQFPEVDYAIRGDAEEPMRLLAHAICSGHDGAVERVPSLVYRHNGTVQHSPRTYFAQTDDLDCLDFVNTDWLLHAESYASVQDSGAGIIALRTAERRGHWLTIGRGCVFNCIYCMEVHYKQFSDYYEYCRALAGSHVR